MRQDVRDAEFQAFVTAAWPRLRRASYLLTHHQQDAEDLLQTVLARAYAGWARVRRDEAYSYVHRALVNAYIDSTRRRRPTPVADTPEGQSTPPYLVVEDRSELVDLLAGLSPRERSIIVWRYYLDASENEVAARFDITPGTVKSTASRALARLRSEQTSNEQNRKPT
jgi:RNA polymerase sigma-70 factor (sigma-E family)